MKTAVLDLRMRILQELLVLVIFYFVMLSGAFAQTFTGGSAELPTVPNTTGKSNPYPLTIEVSGLDGNLETITVTLNIYHGWPDDLDILLVGPTGASSVLMSDAGGGTDLGSVSTGINLTFDQSAAVAVPDALAITAGTYKPADYATVGETFTAPAPAGVHTANLNNFAFTDPNGTWSLYIVDDLGGDVGHLFSWSITITLAEPCLEPPMAGATELIPANVCDGKPFTAVLNDVSGGEGQTYQWQTSADDILYNDISGATADTYSSTGISSGYYRCAVTCGGFTAYSVPEYLSVNGTPSGNTIDDPIIISALPFSADGDNHTSNCWTNTGGYASPDIWYKFVAACDGTLDVSICTESFDSFLSIKNSGGASLANNDDYTMSGCFYLSSGIFDFPVSAGNTYYIVVEGWNSDEGAYNITINPLEIITADSIINVCYGEVVTLNATEGFDAYQWYKNGKIMSGETSSALETIKPGYYQVMAEDGGCELSSEVQSVAVQEDLNVHIKAAGNNTDLCAGAVKLKITASIYSVGLQWYRNDIAIDGATGSVYFPTEAGDYKCIASTLDGCAAESYVISVTNSCRMADKTDDALFSIYPNPAIDKCYLQAQLGNEEDDTAELFLYNALGMLVYSSALQVNAGEIFWEIQLDALASGIYQAVITSGNSQLTRQLIINK